MALTLIVVAVST